MKNILQIEAVSKLYENGVNALSNVSVGIKKGEIFALLGPNGAGKTTLISSICGITRQSQGTIKVNGLDTIHHYKKARAEIGLVPQELTLETFETVWNTVSFSRGLNGKSHDQEYLMSLLKDLSLEDKKNEKIFSLSGGMKRRVLIAKALSHQPSILFLDEPSAGVDVSLRKTLWELIRKLKRSGVTIILTTHYIQEAEELADRVGIIDNGELLLVEDKKALVKKLGKRKLILTIEPNKKPFPKVLKGFNLKFDKAKSEIIYLYDDASQQQDIFEVMSKISKAGFKILDFENHHSSLEEIFIGLVSGEKK